MARRPYASCSAICQPQGSGSTVCLCLSLLTTMHKLKFIAAAIVGVLVLFGAGYQMWLWRDSTRGLRARPLELGAFYNGTLEENWVDPKVPKNNLSTLATGRQAFGGVRFHIGPGLVQLNGKSLAVRKFGPFPTSVTDIAIGQKIKRLHLFHGAYFGAEEGVPVGTLTLRYADGHTHTFAFNYGYHVADWWFHAGERQLPPAARAPDSELAWTGRNAAMGPYDSLRLFRSTFLNPRPGATVASMAYGSAMTDCAPFLVAASVD